MIKVMQTNFDPIHGNCFQACVASIFELRLEQVPHFLNGNEEYTGQWWDDYIIWLNKFGLSSECTEVYDEYRQRWIKYLDKINCYALAGIKCGELHHAVVIKGSKIVHNPWPNYSGNNNEPLINFSFIILRDPASFKLKI